MRYNISELLKHYDQSINLDEDVNLNAIEHNGDVFKFTKPLHLKARIVNDNGFINLIGNVSVEVEVLCHRCLTAIKQTLEFDILETYSKTVEDSENYLIEGEMIDIEPALVYNIQSNLPMKFLCSENCKGFCQVCGSNKNLKDCDCQAGDIDPRLKKLAKYFEK